MPCSTLAFGLSQTSPTRQHFVMTPGFYPTNVTFNAFAEYAFRVGANDFGNRLPSIRKRNFDFIRRFHYVIVRQDVAFGTDNDT